MKWHIPSYSTSAEHRGHTSKQLIRDHKVIWDYKKEIDVRLTTDKKGVLEDNEIHFEVQQEYSPGARAERIVLGMVRCNLAEYCGLDGGEEEEVGDGGEGGEGGEGVLRRGITRRYLMRESKINSTLKVRYLLFKLLEVSLIFCPRSLRSP